MFGSPLNDSYVLIEEGGEIAMVMGSLNRIHDYGGVLVKILLLHSYLVAEKV